MGDRERDSEQDVKEGRGGERKVAKGRRQKQRRWLGFIDRREGEGWDDEGKVGGLEQMGEEVASACHLTRSPSVADIPGCHNRG